MLDGLGVAHGVRLEALLDAGALITAALGRPTQSKVARALRGGGGSSGCGGGSGGGSGDGKAAAAAAAAAAA